MTTIFIKPLKVVQYMLAIIATNRDLECNEYITKERIERSNASVKFERPNGRKEYAKGVSIISAKNINDFSLEYLALEFLRDCNVQCSNCYVSASVVDGKKPRYIDIDFILELAKNLDYSPATGWREICITGGEPTLDMTKLQTRYAILNEFIPNKHIVIATNLLEVPHSEEGVAEFFAKFADAEIQASYNPFLEKQYGIIAQHLDVARYERFKGKVSEEVRPEAALIEKIRLFDDFAHMQGKKFYIRVNGITRRQAEEYRLKAIQYLGTKGRDEHDFIFAHRVVRVGRGKNIEQAVDADDSAIRECKDQEEIYVCVNGALFPTVNHIDQPKKRIGTLVKLL